MSTSLVQKLPSFLTTRRLGVAGAAALLGCAACCAIPLLAAAGLSSGAIALLSSILRPGSELLVSGFVFALALGVMAIRSRRGREASCGPACSVDGSCCDRASATRSA